MLYVSSLAVMAKRAMGPQTVYTAPLSKVIEQLSLDPKTTNMNAVLLGPADLAGVNRAKITKALAAGVHPDICIMFLYTKDSEAKDISIPYMKGVRKINVDEIFNFVNESMDDFMSKSGQLDSDIDALVNADDLKSKDTPKEEYVTPTVAEDTTSKIPEEAPRPEVKVPEVNLEQVDTADQGVMSQPLSGVTPEPNKPVDRTEMLENIRSYEDWTLLKEAMSKDNMVSHIIQENAEYAGAVQMLSVLDMKIKTIWMDPALSPEKKLEQITQIGSEKAALRAGTNSIMVSNVVDILETTAICAKRVVNETVDSINQSLAKITTDVSMVTDTSVITKSIQERIDLQMTLQDMLLQLQRLYGDMDTLTSETTTGLTANLPSDNAFINNMLTPVDTTVFTPANTSQLASKLMTKLQENNVTMSALEDKINSIIRLVFSLFDKDKELLEYYEQLTTMLKANRVEDVVVRDTILKCVLRVYIGADDTGRTATSLTWSGIQSRRANTLLIDISGNPHFDRYGVEAVSLNEFLTSRIERKFLCVASERRLDADEVQQMLSELRTRTNYYSIINVVVQPDDRVALSMLAPEAISFNYITDCRGRSIEAIKQCMGMTAYQNLSKKLIEIDAPINPLQIAEAVGADFTQIKIIPLPSMQDIKACALKKDRPYEYSAVHAIFEEAFR